MCTVLFTLYTQCAVCGVLYKCVMCYIQRYVRYIQWCSVFYTICTLCSVLHTHTHTHCVLCTFKYGSVPIQATRSTSYVGILFNINGSFNFKDVSIKKLINWKCLIRRSPIIKLMCDSIKYGWSINRTIITRLCWAR